MDTVANFLTIIRNGYLVHKTSVRVPASKLNEAIGKLLVAEGFIKSIELDKNKTGRPELMIELRYSNHIPAIEKVRRISKPGLRVYTASDRIPSSLGGLKTVVLSTPNGIQTGELARKAGVGGEIICEIIRGALS